VSLAAHRHRIVVVQLSSSTSHRRRPIVIVVLDDANVDVVLVVVVVVVVVTTIVIHFPIVVVAIAAILVVGVVAVAVPVVIDACRAPWLSIQGIRPKQARAVSPMAWGWSASPWIFRQVADGVSRTTSCQRCRPVGNIMVLSAGGWRKGTLRYSVFLPL
jgi:hypothetical protein